ncbi:MAG TPA: hypothetical protein VLB51_10545 [Methylomirabilota bacterium]|nr:hypothetical protein [Methylomirabilota bacterium]
MKKFVTLALVGALVLGVSSLVYANVCAFDPVPAATILFPFVSFDYDAFDAGINGQTTLFSITNVSAEAQIIHVTVWTDFSAAILDFNILLTGYDVISMNIKDILGNGILPVTIQEGHNTPPSTLTEEGAVANGPVSGANSSINGNWLNPGLDLPQPTNTLGTRCPADPNIGWPGAYAQPIPQGFLDLFRTYLQVSQTVPREHSDECSNYSADSYPLSPTPFWVGRDTTDPTWMYITVDVVERCNKLFPDEPAYWVPFDDPGGQGVARYDNVLIGDVFWVNAAERFSEASNAVHLEADRELGNVATIGPAGDPVSFYHRYSTQQLRPNDAREPLPTAWAFRYLGAGSASTGTDVRVWKGSSIFRFTNDLERVGINEFQPDELIASNCHAYTYYAWDEDEQVTTVSTVPWSQPGSPGSVIPNLIPLETQEVPVDQFDTPGANGWMLFVWPASNYPPATATRPFDDLYQTWMGVRYNAYGNWSAAMDGVVMANFNCFSDQVLPNLGVNYDYVDATGYVTSPALPVN